MILTEQGEVGAYHKIADIDNFFFVMFHSKSEDISNLICTICERNKRMKSGIARGATLPSSSYVSQKLQINENRVFVHVC